MTLNELRDEAYQNSVAHGWYEGEFCIPEKLALVHSEVSEALEDYRNGAMRLIKDADGKPVGFPSEIADILIRVFDLCGRLGIDLEEAVKMKMAHNQTRPYRHGGRKC